MQYISLLCWTNILSRKWKKKKQQKEKLSRFHSENLEVARERGSSGAWIVEVRGWWFLSKTAGCNMHAARSLILTSGSIQQFSQLYLTYWYRNAEHFEWPFEFPLKKRTETESEKGSYYSYLHDDNVFDSSASFGNEKSRWKGQKSKAFVDSASVELQKIYH